MILIFGGTTEGRTAVRVLDGADQTYYYSTRGENQQVECKHGFRVSGGMDLSGMRTFCREKAIRLIVDAAHPFAVELHRNIEAVSEMLQIPVVRYERTYPLRDPAFIWCDGYEEAMDYLEQNHIDDLLALTGVQTISRLERYWKRNNCWFRILNREESQDLAVKQGFPVDRLLYFNDGEEDMLLLRRLHPGAILTKESGTSGFFDEKANAAKACDIPVVVIKRPLPPDTCYVVTGEHGLRNRVERLLPGFFPLMSGYTTGSCACAAVKSALLALMTGVGAEECMIALPCGEEITLKTENSAITLDGAVCTVVKDAGDDPDVTNGCRISAKVNLCDKTGVHFLQGEGVGKVTLPGLGLAIGEPAINPVPRRMITAEVEKILRQYGRTGGVEVTISVENGAELALKTFNPKLGIVGGISIIGTSGIVQPFSTEAFIRSIRKEVQVARALGCLHLVINSGAKSERVLRESFSFLLPQAFIHYGNFIGETLKIAEEEGIQQITMGIMIGKAVKLAEGNPDTHSRNVTMNRVFIADLARESGCLPESVARVENITLARELWEIFAGEERFFHRLTEKCHESCRIFLKQACLKIILIPESDEKIAK